MARTPPASPLVSPRRRVLVTSLAAAATLVVVAVVLAGPSIVSCSAAGENLAACLRSRMVDAGILPQGSPVLPPVEAVATPETTAAEPAVATEARALDTVAPSTETLVTDTPEAVTSPAAGTPAVTLFRVEADGAFIMAGTAEPGESVEVYAGGTLIGTAVAEASGDWVLIPDAPLPRGSATVTVGASGKARQSFDVEVSTDGSTVPLVVAKTPGAELDVLQAVEPAPPASQDVAAIAEPARPIESSAPVVVEPVPVAEADAPEVSASAGPEPTSAAPGPAVTAAPVPAIDTEIPARAAESTETAAVAPEAAASPRPAATTVPSIPPTIDAIEIDGSRNLFAGSAEEGASVRLYVDEAYVGAAVVVRGRWLIEADDVLTMNAQRIRIEVQAGSSASGAEVNFIVQQPVIIAAAPEPVVPTIAPASEGLPDLPVDLAEMTPPPVPTAQTAAAPALLDPPAVPIVPPPVPELRVAATPAMLDPPRVPVAVLPLPDQLAGLAPAPRTPPPVPALVPDGQVAPADLPLSAETLPVAAAPALGGTPGVADTPAQANWADVVAGEPADDTEGPVDVAAAPRQDPVRRTSSPSVVAAPILHSTPSIEVLGALAEPMMPVRDPRVSQPGPGGEVPTLVAVPLGDPANARFASSKAIIRNGDTLWSIAARVYGAGLKYRLIFDANRELIRNPDRIFPGQVFNLPQE